MELLWRYARAYNALSSTISGNNEKKKKIINEDNFFKLKILNFYLTFLFLGLIYAQKAYDIDFNNFNAIKFLAILTGELANFLPLKERIQYGVLFKVILVIIIIIKK